jgi:hypothetical protein
MLVPTPIVPIPRLHATSRVWHEQLPALWRVEPAVIHGRFARGAPTGHVEPLGALFDAGDH